MKFIQVTFSGGLGNQLFQYAMARSLMTKNDRLFFDIHNYIEDYLNRSFKLSNYRVKGTILFNRLLKKIFIPKSKTNTLLAHFNMFSKIKENSFLLHKNLAAHCRLFTALEGFWQSDTYFISIRTQLLEELKPFTVPTFPGFMRHSVTVAVHVRRTDYLQDKRYGFLGEDYYRNALHIMKQKLNDPTIIFFSDDIPWCKQVFKDDNIFFCEAPEWEKDYLQLYLMSKCKHQVIANSSFSWWGAWLNQNDDKIVIRPANPFIDKSLYYENHYPPEWIAV